MANVEYESCDLLAPSLYIDQPNIPFVLFKPKIATAENPIPLMIHTHGGPNVYMDKNDPHANIAKKRCNGCDIEVEMERVYSLNNNGVCLIS